MTNPKLEVLTPQNSQLIFIDHQPQMAFGVQSIDRQTGSVSRGRIAGLSCISQSSSMVRSVRKTGLRSGG